MFCERRHGRTDIAFRRGEARRQAQLPNRQGFAVTFRRFVLPPGDAEIYQLGRAIVHDENIAWSQIAVNDQILVHYVGVGKAWKNLPFALETVDQYIGKYAGRITLIAIW